MSQLAFVLGLVVLPYLALVGAFIFLFRAQLRRPRTASKIPLYSLGTSAVLTAAVVVWGFYFLFSSGSSTAGIGFLFLPIYALGTAIAGSIITWAFLTLVSLSSTIRIRLYAKKPSGTKTLLAMAVLLIGPVGALTYGPRVSLLSEAKSLDTQVQRLEKIADAAVAKNDLRALEVLAGNFGASAVILERVYSHCAKVPGELRASPCYAAFQHLAGHKNTPVPLLAKLANSAEISVRAGVARNRVAPVSLLQELSSDEDPRVRKSLVWNPNLPLPILTKLTLDDDESVRSWAEDVMKRRKAEEQ